MIIVLEIWQKCRQGGRGSKNPKNLRDVIYGWPLHKEPCSHLNSQNKCGDRSIKRSIRQTNFNKRRGHNWFLSLLCCGDGHRSTEPFDPRMVLAASNNGRNCSVVSHPSLALARQLTLMRLAQDRERMVMIPQVKWKMQKSQVKHAIPREFASCNGSHRSTQRD